MKAEQLKASGGVLGVSNALSGFLEMLRVGVWNAFKAQATLSHGQLQLAEGA
jgi:hypothetical protein